MKIRKGDLVKIISGKSRGKTGKVISIDNKKNKVLVEKINVVKKHNRQTNDPNNPGGIKEIEKPVDISNVQLMCQECNKPTRIGFKVDKGKKSRYCKKCNKIIA
jgi:large subunit ribosomal protein L24